MVLLAEIILISILLIALITLIIEEGRIKKSKIPRGTIKEYWSGQERRQHLRIATSLIVRYSVERKININLNGRMKDISSDGMRLLANEKLTKGTLLLLEFDLPETKDSVNAEGKVMWANGKFNERDEIGRRIFNTGIQFVSITPDNRSKLVTYIKKIAEKSDERTEKI